MHSLFLLSLILGIALSVSTCTSPPLLAVRLVLVFFTRANLLGRFRNDIL